MLHRKPGGLREEHSIRITASPLSKAGKPGSKDIAEAVLRSKSMRAGAWHEEYACLGLRASIQ